MDFLRDTAQWLWQSAQHLVMYPFDPGQRIYVLYVLTSVLIAFAIYKSARGRLSADETNFVRFLFPKKVWSHPSAWLDLRYFFFHSLVVKAMILGLTGWAMTLSFGWIMGDVSLREVQKANDLSTGADLAIAFCYMIMAMIVIDFLGWFCHYLQHKSPFLWQFHKVHHSAEVMHPISNYREHPMDNLVYIVVIGAGYGVNLAVAVRVFGYAPSMPSLLGVPILMLLFNLVGYNLRHSHVWLRWPGVWSMIFPSPAHHHVHHSYHPDHIDKNFAFMFPIWDVIFRTYHMPEDNRDVQFGIGEGNAEELTSCVRLYLVPIRDAYRVILAQFMGRDFNMSRPEPVSRKADPETVHPAE